MSETPEAARKRVAAHTRALRLLAQAHPAEFAQLHNAERRKAGLAPIVRLVRRAS